MAQWLERPTGIWKVVGSTLVGGSENSFSEYFDLRTLLHYLYHLCLDDASEDQKEEFLHEIEQMKLLGSHQNIVSLVGCCTLQEHKFLVIEYVPFGDLLQWLRRRRRSVRRFQK